MASSKLPSLSKSER
uniref:Uncharacterized protein n=1 Tax=Arundo donax TaxID=35708 RepID=A0A0A9EMS7_ARUDO